MISVIHEAPTKAALGFNGDCTFCFKVLDSEVLFTSVGFSGSIICCFKIMKQISFKVAPDKNQYIKTTDDIK